MVLLTISEILAKSTWLILQKSINMGYELAFGKTKTTEEKLLEQVTKLQEELKRQKENEMRLLQELKNEQTQIKHNQITKDNALALMYGMMLNSRVGKQNPLKYDYHQNYENYSGMDILSDNSNYFFNQYDKYEEYDNMDENGKFINFDSDVECECGEEICECEFQKLQPTID